MILITQRHTAMDSAIDPNHNSIGKIPTLPNNISSRLESHPIKGFSRTPTNYLVHMKD